MPRVTVSMALMVVLGGTFACEKPSSQTSKPSQTSGPSPSAYKIEEQRLGPIHEQVLELKKSHPELYEMLNRQLKQATVQAGPGIGYPLNPLILPVVGEKPGREEQLEEGLELEPEEDLEEGLSLREWTRARAKKTGIICGLHTTTWRESRALSTMSRYMAPTRAPGKAPRIAMQPSAFGGISWAARPPAASTVHPMVWD